MVSSRIPCNILFFTCFLCVHAFFSYITISEGAVDSPLVRSYPDQVVQVWSLARVTVLCSWARHFTLRALIHQGV